MSFATKNNAIIVKDGKIAENCGCCGKSCASLSAQDEIVLQLTCEDRYQYAVETVTVEHQTTCTVGKKRGYTGFFPGNAYAGTYVLSKVGVGLWRYNFPLGAPICPDPFNWFLPSIYRNPQIELSEWSGSGETFCYYRLSLYFTTLLYCDYGADTKRQKTEFDCIARNPTTVCVPATTSIYSEVRRFSLAPTTVSVDLALPSPIQIYTGNIVVVPTCSGASEYVSRQVVEDTGSSTVSVSLVI